MTTTPNTADILVADVGNTRTKWARLSHATAPRALREVVTHGFIPGSTPLTPVLIEEVLGEHLQTVSQVLMSGSQQERIAEWEAVWPGTAVALRVIRTARELPIELAVDAPEKVGVDRVLNALAVARLRSAGSPAIVVDAGTAITVDAISSHGVFLGGAILPGYELSARALHDYTSRLPLIPQEEILGQTPPIVGTNTHAALRSGLIWGQVGAVNEITARMTASLETEAKIEPQFFLTGGAAPLLVSHLRANFRHSPSLTVQGLGCLA